MASSGTATVTLPTDEQILITREFDAPRHLVYTAWTTPDLVKRWWGANMGEMTVTEIDLRVGGAWRYVMALDDGSEVAFHGEYREIVPNERIVSPGRAHQLRDGGGVAEGYGPARAGRGLASLSRASALLPCRRPRTRAARFVIVSGLLEV